MKGLHIIGDLYNCPDNDLLVSAKKLRILCMEACVKAGLSVLGEHFYQFDGFDDTQVGGATGAVVLAESHLAIHTWPEMHQATLDVYVCNVTGDNSAKAEHLFNTLIEAFKPGDLVSDHVWRGKDLPLLKPAKAA
jgi:S-adenosylmethionine decarboxylase proenzyme